MKVRTALTATLLLLATVVVDSPAAPSGDPQSPQAKAREPQRVLLMDREREAVLRKLLPKVADETVQEALDDPSSILYTELEMPRAYQSWSGPVRGVHAANYNVSANRSERYGNGNREFPWGARRAPIARKTCGRSVLCGCRATTTAACFPSFGSARRSAETTDADTPGDSRPAPWWAKYC